MANEQKMLPPNIRVDWVPGTDGISDVNAPTVDELDAGTNISCAITQPDFTLGFTDRDTDNTKSLCAGSNVAIPIYKNYEANLTFFRDRNIDEVESVYNEAYELFKNPLQQGFLVKRVGYAYDDEYADGQDVQVFAVESGDPTTMHEDGVPVRMQVMFYMRGESSDGYVPIGGAS